MAGAFISYRNWLDIEANSVSVTTGGNLDGFTAGNLFTQPLSHKFIGDSDDGLVLVTCDLAGDQTYHVIGVFGHNFRSASMTGEIRTLDGDLTANMGDLINIGGEPILLLDPDGHGDTGARFGWSYAGAEDSTVEIGRFWGGDAIYLDKGIDVEFTMGFDPIDNETPSRGREIYPKARTSSRRVQVTVSNLPVELVFGDPADPSAPCFLDMAMTVGNSQELVIIPSTSSEFRKAAIALYCTVSPGKSISIRPSEGGSTYRVSFEVSEIVG